jgi:uncharacterized protein YjbI with pentapeptide repeats
MITCPKCYQLNSDDAVTCRRCRLELARHKEANPFPDRKSRIRWKPVENGLYDFISQMDEFLGDDINRSEWEYDHANKWLIDALGQLDRREKANALQYLIENRLIESENPALSLKGALLQQVDLAETDLSDIDLSGAILTSANLKAANLTGSKLRNTDLNRARMQSAKLDNTTFLGAYLIRSNLVGSSLRAAYLVKTDMERANLSGADLTAAWLKGAKLRSANVSMADLRTADLTETNLRQASLIGTFLGEANLNSTDVRGADLRDTNLRGARIQHVIYDEFTQGQEDHFPPRGYDPYDDPIDDYGPYHLTGTYIA